MPHHRVQEIQRILTQTLCAAMCEVRDDSAAHIGHAGAAYGAGHYCVLIVAKCFEGLSAVARHRQVYQALAGWMGPEIHALQIQAHTPDEWDQRASSTS